MRDDPEILFDLRDGVAKVTLNRPQALNALTLDMVRVLDPQLAAWETDDAVRAIVVRGSGEKAFCAGGDVQKLYDGAPGCAVHQEFFREEYRLNWRIHNYPKPYIALMDGITMGGGVGLSVHAGTRIAADNTMFAMPETGIGLFPDVGGSWFLPHLPGEIGMFMAMTGARLKAADCVYAGICDGYIPNDRHDGLIDALRGGGSLDEAVARFSEVPGEAPLAVQRDAIDRCFAGDTVEAIIAALEGEGGEWAEKQLSIMAGKSPTSQKISHRQLREGARLNFDDCMIMEYRMSQHLMEGGDFFEGVRAVVVDKDMSPKWSPAALSDLSESDVEKYFAPLGDRDLTFPA
jgi:enoyl-CoA hydratase